MMKKAVGGAVVFLGVLGSSINHAQADQRSYVWTYECQTLPRGEAELEYYHTISAPNTSSLKTNVTTEQKIEYEVGMTDHFDFGIYQVFEQTPSEGLQYKAFQLRARYRFDQKQEHLVDSLIYLEYEGVPDFSEHVIETKWVLAKDLGRFNVAVNPILELEIEDEAEVEPGYAVGMSYKANDLLRVGLEAKGDEKGHYVGPVISHGKGRFWITLGSAFAVSHVDADEPEFQTRMLLGIGL